MSLNDIKGFVEAEINVPPAAQNYIINDSIVTNAARSLTDLGVNEGDILSLAIQTQPQNPGRPTQAAPSQPPRQQAGGRQESPDPELLRLQLLANGSMLRQVRNNDPELADATGDAESFARTWRDRERVRTTAQREKEAMIAQLQADPFNVEAQQKIEEMIRQERVIENMQKALEENPESFGHVTMLYIDVLVNNTPIKAFVDSGAQTTIMSPDAAERCGIMRLIDKRFAGIARGVGTAQILGRVHSADIQIGPYNLASSFTVMEGKDVDLLLGLDMLKRHQMCVDLKENCLRVADDKVRFLPDSEIPKMMDNINEKEPKVEGPGGMEIGATTGTVKPAPASAPSQASSWSVDIHPMGSAGHINTSGAPAPSPAPSQPPTKAPPTTSQEFPERAIIQVMSLGGVDRDQALGVLRQAGGSVELAIDLLFG